MDKRESNENRGQDKAEVVVPYGVTAVTSRRVVRSVAEGETIATERTLVLTGDETLTVPLVAEMLAAEAVWRDAGIVRLRLHGEEFSQTVSAETIREELYTEQVAIGRVLADGEVVEPRQEGDVYVLPVIREEAVVVKRRILDHELRVTKRAVTETQTVEATLRRTHATVDAGNLSARTHVEGAMCTDEAHEAGRRQ